MFSADDFRQYAQECIESARAADSDAIRVHFLNMAKTWTTAATQIEYDIHAAATAPPVNGASPDHSHP